MDVLTSFASQLFFFGSSHMPLATRCKNADKKKRTVSVEIVFPNNGSSKLDQMPAIVTKARATPTAMKTIPEITNSRLNPVIGFESVLSAKGFGSFGIAVAGCA